VVFHPRGRDQTRAIAEIQLTGLRARLADLDIGLTVDVEAMDMLADAGFDPVYGARPLKRAIQRSLENPLAQALLEGRYGRGDTVRVSYEGDAFCFDKATEAAA